jgi:antitoxin component HigA of HigAB toxin-antitoxin module
METFEQVKTYIDSNNKRPSNTDKDKQIKQLGSWISNQQKNYKKKAEIMKNEEIYNNWTNLLNDDKYKQYLLSNEDNWMETLEQVKTYIDTNNKRPSKEDEEAEPVLVYEHDLYVVKRLYDASAGEMALFRLHLPHDGLKEFAVSTSVISSKDELRKQLAHQGVVAHEAQYKHLASYVVTTIKNLQFQKKAEIMRTQFGWADDNSKFIFGEKEINKDGVFFCPLAGDAKFFANKIKTKGTLDKWKEVFNMYAVPGMEAHAFGALSGFGSLLFKFTGLDGAMINVIHQNSGTGKSTILRMANSIYGDPKGLMAIEKDTFNAKMHQLGVMNNLPNTIDEITNLSGMEFSDLAFSISQGRGKN